MSLGVLIVDDEPLARLGISTRLAQHPEFHVIGECQDGQDALELVTTLSPDLVFLDVAMPGISGVDCLRSFPKEKMPCVVFVTAHEEHAVDAFALEATDYLLKPINKERFAACLQRVHRVIALSQQEARLEHLYGRLEDVGHPRENEPIRQFAVRKGKQLSFLNAADVDWIEGLGDYAGLHVGSSTHLIRRTLASLNDRLDPTLFVRIHRSTIVQVNRIVRIETLTNRDSIVTLCSRVVLRASRSYAASLHHLLPP